MSLSISGRWFLDRQGRRVLLRGVNLGGSSKLPVGCDPLRAADPAGAAAASFVGRPFPLDEADEHFSRLRHWGFNALRFLTTWEAVEHAGPGLYDHAYLDYLQAVVEIAGRHRFYVFIDPHQDAWSRFSGGDGAPAWTLELLGFDLQALDASEAAITITGRYPDYPAMIWPNNWTRLACATMFTLFFAGNACAPGLEIEGEPVQEFLQRRFIAAMTQVARRLRGLACVLGYDSLNEPCPGYIGLRSLSRPLPVYNSAPQLTGLDSLAIPAGYPGVVPLIQRQHLEQVPAGSVEGSNPARRCAWTDPAADPWRRLGVWRVDVSGRPVVVRDDYFAGIKFFSQGVLPFARRYAEAMRDAHPGAIIFIEGEPGSPEPLVWDAEIPVVNASHWYDLLTLITKHYDPAAALEWGSLSKVEGEENVRTAFAAQVAALAAQSERHLCGAPTLIGEFGLPFDLDGGDAYRTGNFEPHVRALSAYYDALDTNLVHSTLWNYTADNSNAWGDQWNQEDLSIFSRDQQSNPADPDSGGRAIDGFCRPTVRACAGIPRRQAFCLETKVFTLEIEATGGSGPTLVYLPNRYYARSIQAQVSSGHISHDPANQLLTWSGAAAGPQALEVRPG